MKGRDKALWLAEKILFPVLVVCNVDTPAPPGLLEVVGIYVLWEGGMFLSLFELLALSESLVQISSSCRPFYRTHPSRLLFSSVGSIWGSLGANKARDELWEKGDTRGKKPSRDDFCCGLFLFPAQISSGPSRLAGNVEKRVDCV